MLRPALRAPAQILVVLLALAVPAPASAAIEDYASYQPQTKCRPHAKPGTTYLGQWLVRRYGGGFGPIGRPCGSGGASEHKEGRAFDWTLDAAHKADRRRARTFLDRAFRTDPRGHDDARARRMGIMYVIWKDTMYPAWNEFEAEPYLSSGCTSKKKCSKTLRHRDHVHLSLSKPGGRAETTWYNRSS